MCLLVILENMIVAHTGIVFKFLQTWAERASRTGLKFVEFENVRRYKG